MNKSNIMIKSVWENMKLFFVLDLYGFSLKNLVISFFF